MFTSKPPTCTGRTLDLSRKDSDIRYLRHLGNSDIAKHCHRLTWLENTVCIWRGTAGSRKVRRQTQHPLPHGHPREHLVDQVRRALGHAPSAAARTEPAPMTRERHEAVEPTSLAPKPREAPAEPPAPKKVAELLLDEAGQPLAGAEVGCLHTKRLEVIAHHLIQDAARGLPWLVCRRWRRHTRRSAEPMPLRATSETGECSSDEARSHAVSAYATGTASGSLWDRAHTCAI